MNSTLIGHVDIVSHGLIGGWAADTSKPHQQVTLTLTVNGSTTNVRAGRPRNDLKRLFENATGEYGFRLRESPWPLSPFVENQVQVCFAADGKTVPGGKATLPPLGTPQPAAARAGRMTPILVTTTGRAGSSLLMARLAQHPDVVVARDHPYELKLLGYYALALNTLVSSADRERSTNPDNMRSGSERFFIGFNPYNDETEWRDPDMNSFWKQSSPDILRASFVALLDAYYDRVANRSGRPGARFFAEKIGTSELTRHAASFMYGAVHEVMLVRDPRDVICSAKSFWNRSFDDSIASLRHGLQAMTRPRVEGGLRQHVVRYEDLILKPDDVMRDLFVFLGLAFAPLLDDEKENRVFQVHGTSGSPDRTIGRWRHELTPENIAVANHEFSSFLRDHGYGDA